MSSHQRPSSVPPDPDETLASRDISLAHSSDFDSAVPFYNTTFSAHRVSPLYIGKQKLTPRRLETLAHRLRDMLVGDVVRGVEVGMEGDFLGLGRVGSLEAVEVRWVALKGLLDLGRGREGSRDLGEEEDEGEEEFLRMPLLLMRMPVPLKGVMAEFLATEFDCRVSALRLGTRSMVRSWEGWIRTAGLPTKGPLAKDVVVTLGFYIPPKEGVEDADEEEEEEGSGQMGLKSIDVFIPAAELRKFVDAGAEFWRTKPKGTAATWEEDAAKRRKLAGRLHEEGWEWRQKRTGDEVSALEEQHFTEALGRYIDKHLGLNLFHPGVRIIKIACGGFVMSEGRIKVFAPADLREADGGSASSGQRGAVWELLKGLVGKANAGSGM
ncbi:kinetochore complex Sim4 subunit Fta1-domain-containing protein [Podospora aff. communis PSN243]|uniref:Kinetochore complex Sim4 subunit Fta1-domain-containing protein n=1 Tax=Podospora aff. communis PSN243 TaxID=3040156 RepID=A0AAV9GEM4_9PEZI|nr:kinetochore complex Sim4 subunit Fta1-domain-containing protein [Podospora aff. communis PSN243]